PDGTVGSSLLALLVVLLAAGGAAASCDPGTDPDQADIANARAAVAARCNCGTALSQRDYVRCSATIAEETLVNADCRSAVQACAKRSTCGREGAVTCCRTTAKGVTKCSIKRDVSVCRAPSGGTACLANVSSCCDACPTGCPVSTSTTTTTQPCRSFDCSGFSLPPPHSRHILPPHILTPPPP